MCENYKSIIINELETVSKKETIEKNIFKVRAYQKVIGQIKLLDKIESWKDLENVNGIGVKIKEKITEIFETGKLNLAEKARSKHNLEIYDIFMKIHGVGATKAKELVESHGINSIENLKEKLKENPKLLNNKQKCGLKYYEDINIKIPRKEMKEHDEFIQNTLKDMDKDIDISVVGSYRRKVKQSGDIDVLITIRRETTIKERSELMNNIIKKLTEINYIKSTLANGDKKYMGIVKLKRKRYARRMDILITSQEEYPFAMLYFTGSQELNILLRKDALERGFRLNEYSLLDSNENKILLKSEEEIFNKLGYKYIEPEIRKKEKEINRFKL
jgi:DNA polymerase/3'-5' exonuclease PolX